MNPSKFSDLRIHEWALIVVCAVIASASLYVLFVDDSLLKRTMRTDLFDTAPVIGTINYAINDIRHKRANHIDWETAELDQDVFLGDGVFSGERSRSQVTLKTGEKIFLAENTMLVFREIKGQKTADLSMGNFKLWVDGKMKVAVQGVVTEIQGSKSEVQVIVEKNHKPKLKLLKGTARVQSQNEAKPTEIVSERFTDLENFVQQQQVAVPAQFREVRPLPGEKILYYTDSVYDFYERAGRGLKLRSTPASDVYFPTKLKWSSTAGGDKVYVEYTTSQDNNAVGQRFESNEGQLELMHVHIGENFWKISLEKRHWSEIQKFQVERGALNVQAPVLRAPGQVYIGDHIELPIEKKASIGHSIIEISATPEFKPAQTQVLWMSKDQLQLDMEKPGFLFIRTRGVNAQNQITAYSAVSKIQTVRKPLRKKAVEPMLQLVQREMLKPPLKDRVRSIAAEQEPAVVATPTAMKFEQEEKSRSWISFGGGFNFVQFAQTMTTAPEVNYASVAGPSLAFKGGVELIKWGFEAEYNPSAGKIVAENTTISKTEFIWQTIAMEGLYQLFDVSSLIGHARLGGQYHSLPYLRVDDSTLQLNEYNVGKISAGFDLWYKTRSSLSYQFLMRYQAPAYVRADPYFKPSSQFAFDGSLGAQYKFKDKMSLGLFWYGQWQQYRYTLLQGDGSLDSGDQKLFFSNMELRFGYDF